MSIHTRHLRQIRQTQLHTPWRPIYMHRRGYTTVSDGEEEWFQKLRNEMLSRPSVSSREYISIDTDHKLVDSLSTFMPPNWCRRFDRGKGTVPLGHVLVWFNTSMPVDQLLPDGTDPLQSPGEPWVRRMWAGSSMMARRDAYYDLDKGFAIGTDMVYVERIQDVLLRGSGATAKLHVAIERRYARLDTLNEKLAFRSPTSANNVLREQMLRGEEWGDAVLKEQRNLVFLREKTPAELEAIAAGQLVPIKYLESPGNPDFSHSLTPTRSLLFRYSALTLNAHLIHLDRDYARNVEGHRNLLVHGPLSLTLMMQVMWGYIKREAGSKYIVESVKYRNLAPLYCDEEMRICVKKKEALADGASYDVWIEGPVGGVAVKGTVRTVQRIHAHGCNITTATGEPGVVKVRKFSTGGQATDISSNAKVGRPRQESREPEEMDPTTENEGAKQADSGYTISPVQPSNGIPISKQMVGSPSLHESSSVARESTKFQRRGGPRTVGLPSIRNVAKLPRRERDEDRRYGF